MPHFHATNININIKINRNPKWTRTFENLCKL